MFRELKNVLKKILFSRNIRVVRTVEKEKVLDFISRVRPIKTNHDLVRIGAYGDGGYLVPDDLKGIATCFSPGVAETASFEEDLAKRGIRCFLADYSVDAPPISSPLFDFEKKYLGPYGSDVYVTLESWMKRKAPEGSDSILEMDIEGSEYGVLSATSPETLRRFRVLVIEFHHLDRLVERSGYETISQVFSKLLLDFKVVHIHPNNTVEPIDYQGIVIPPVMEFTFIRSDRIDNQEPAALFPHALDRTCVPSAKDIVLPACWYSPTAVNSHLQGVKGP